MKKIFDPNNTRILTGFRRHKNLKELLRTIIILLFNGSGSKFEANSTELFNRVTVK